MTLRDYTVNGMVKLPRLDARLAVALGLEMQVAARSVTLPILLQSPHVSFEAKLEALKNEISLLPDPLQPSATIELDQEFDARWSGLSDFLGGWAKLSKSVPQAQKAQKLLEVAFRDGLRFTKADHRTEWIESETRLANLTKEPNATLVREVGAEPFVEEVREAHRRLGEAIGITAVRPTEEEGPKVRQCMDEFARALRSYILHVAVHAESGEPGAEQLAQKLLAPVAEWRAVPRMTKTEAASKAQPVSN